MIAYTATSAAPSIQLDSPSKVMKALMITASATDTTSIGGNTRVSGAKPSACEAITSTGAKTSAICSGELMITDNGVEGSLIYALSAPLRDAIEKNGSITLYLDLLPAHESSLVAAEIAHPRSSRSLSSHLQSRLGIKGVKMALLHECVAREDFSNPQKLAAAIKSLPIKLISPRPLEEAISSAGGVDFKALDNQLMLKHLPGVFCAGEMLDWEAPTGGYLLTACFASGYVAGQGVLSWLRKKDDNS